jgi:group I intron endonuclease
MIIYKATNKIDGKCYIGQTITTLDIRIKRHNNAKNRNMYFSKAIKKYGIDNFKWTILEFCYSEEELNEKEQWYIEHFNSFGKNGYNMCKGGGGTSGYSVSEETKEKLRKFNTGKKMSEETKKKISQKGLGNKNTFGKKSSEETKEKLRISSTGRKLSKESKDKISKSKLGKKRPDLAELNRKLKKGKPLSEEHINKIKNQKRDEKGHFC